jgi:hypothetical protein
VPFNCVLYVEAYNDGQEVDDDGVDVVGFEVHGDSPNSGGKDPGEDELPKPMAMDRKSV